MEQRQPPDGEHRRDEIDDGFPAQREPRVHPRDRLPQCELEVKRAVHDDGQYDDGQRNRTDVVGRERRRPHRATHPRVHQAYEGGPRGEMGRVAERGAQRQSPQHDVADQHRERRDDRGECPAAIENGEQQHPDDVGREPVAREGDAEAA